VTVIEAGPCPVISVAEGRAGLGFGAKKAKRTAKALAGHVRKAGIETAPRPIRRFTGVRGAPPAGPAPPPSAVSRERRLAGEGARRRQGPWISGRRAPPSLWGRSRDPRQHAAPQAGIDRAGNRPVADY